MTDAFVGIDIGKFKFDVAVLSKHNVTRHRIFTDDEEGFEKLQSWLELDLFVFEAHYCMSERGTTVVASAFDGIQRATGNGAICITR